MMGGGVGTILLLIVLVVVVWAILKVDHYVLHVRIKMRSGGCVAFSQNTDADTREG